MEENLVGFVLALYAKRWYNSQVSVDDQTGIWMRPVSSGDAISKSCNTFFIGESTLYASKIPFSVILGLEYKWEMLHCEPSTREVLRGLTLD